MCPIHSHVSCKLEVGVGCGAGAAPSRSVTSTSVIASLGIIGLVETVGATPDGSQNLRGLGGRIFAVEVFDPATGDFLFPNCYTFYPDGTWDDPGFPVLGVWNQDSNGAMTSYGAGATATDFDIADPGDPPFLITLVLEQRGTVTPAHGGGNLQLWAFSQAIIVEFGDLVVGEFFGHAPAGRAVRSGPLVLHQLHPTGATFFCRRNRTRFRRYTIRPADCPRMKTGSPR